ncbi:amidase family protein [Domibacillus tundrae]|uniref:amidase family protein n=1 Tax=Domibacillus tundrae TaxID=1587527 RepID=UPI0006981553|nr:amidase family protein [Domibacillus tundrae]
MKKQNENVALFLTSITMGLSLFSTTAGAEFSDVGGSLAKEVTEAKELGLVSGYIDGTFKPKQAVTRGEFARLVVTAYESISDENLSDEMTGKFKDVSSTSTLGPYILKAAEKGWIAGFSDGTFRPNEPVLREQAARILAEAADLATESEPFDDVVDGSTFAGSIGAVEKVELMYGDTKGNFNPKLHITREQSAATILRLFRYLEEEMVAHFEIEEATIFEMSAAMEEGKLKSEELVRFYLERIEKFDQQGPMINSMISLNEEAIETAKQLDKERAEGKIRGTLHGIPIVLKDNYDTFDMPTTAGSLSLEGSMAPDDAFQTAKLRAEGAIILGKANLHEFAFGFNTYSSLGGQTLNPYDVTRYPGGSSGGTGAAVASNFAAVGLGTDTGGSIRIPATFNSLVGIRPTMGLASRDGIIPLALTQDVGGPLARTVEDAAVVLDAIAGYDEADPVTEKGNGQIPDSYTDYLDKNGLEGARIGVVRALFGEDEQVIEATEQAIDDMESLGAEVIDVTIPNLETIMAYPSLSSYEFKFQLNDYLASLGEKAPVKSLSDIIVSGKYHPSLDSALKAREAKVSLDDPAYVEIVTNRPKITTENLMEVYNGQDVDALMYPTSTMLPQKIGEDQGAGTNNRLSPFSGYPAMSVPIGFSEEGLPIGMELLGTAFSEPTLIKLAYSYQEGTHHRQSPDFQ